MPAKPNDPERHFKQELFSHLARIGKVLGSHNRLELLELIAQGERTVENLAQVSGLSIANASQHLLRLKNAGLVISRKEGLNVHYRLSTPDVVDLICALRGIAQSQLAEVDLLIKGHLTHKDQLEPVSHHELMRRVEHNEITLIDVRPKDEFAAGHLPSAINIPSEEIDEYLDTFDSNKDIVAYCRGPYCILAYNAVARLRDHGLQAYRLEDGYPEWASAGLPVQIKNSMVTFRRSAPS